MTDEGLDAIEKRASITPEGGYTVDESGFLRPIVQTCEMEDHHDCAALQVAWLNQSHEWGFNKELAAFFSSAGGDVRTLIAEVKRLRALASVARAAALEEAQMAVCGNCNYYGIDSATFHEEWKPESQDRQIRGWLHPGSADMYVECQAARLRALLSGS